MDQESINQESEGSFEIVETTMPKEVIEFPSPLRNLMVKLMNKGSINFEDHKDMFNLLLTKRALVESYLANLNLKVEINAEKGVAFIHNYVREDDFEPGEEISNDDLADRSSDADRDLFLISSRKLSVYDTIVILILRRFYQERANSQGENFVVIDVERIKTLMIPYLPNSSSTTRDGKNINGILSRLQEKQLIKRLSGEDEDRYQIMPLIHYIINVEAMEKMLEQYQKLASTYNLDVPQNQSAR